LSALHLARSGVTYFALVFAAGFVFGILRQLVLVPLIGATVAVAVEAPMILAVSAVVARWRVKAVDADASDAVAIGMIALVLLLVAEALLAGPVRGWDFGQWLRHFSEPDGTLSLLLYLAFAAMPWIVWRQSDRRR